MVRAARRPPQHDAMGSSGDSAMVTGIKHTFCGAAAGAVTKTSTAPLERVICVGTRP